MPRQITCASALPGKTWKQKKSHYSLKCCISRQRCSSWAVLHAQCTSALSSWKKTGHLWCVWWRLYLL